MLEYLNVREVAAMLRVCPETVRRHVKAGRLPVLAISRRLHRFKRVDVLAFAEQAAPTGLTPRPGQTTGGLTDDYRSSLVSGFGQSLVEDDNQKVNR